MEKLNVIMTKIHMYDAKLSRKEKYFESKLFKSGNKIKLAKLPWKTWVYLFVMI